MSVLTRPVIVLDTETTGLPRDHAARPWQLAAVLLDLDGQEISSFESDMLPDPFPDTPPVREALRFLGVERSTIEAAPPSSVVLPKFARWWREAGHPRITSFNVEFDREMLLRADFDPWRSGWTTCIMLAAHAVMQADESYPGHRWTDGSLKWPRLDEAARYFGVPIVEPAHRALSDARTAAGVLVAVQRLRLAMKAARNTTQG